MKTRLFAPIPLRAILITPFVTLTVLVVGLVGYLSFRNSEQAINDVAHQLRAEITARIESYVRSFLNTPPHINQLNADTIREGWPAADDATALERHLWEQIQSFDSVTSIYFGNSAGGLVDAGREGAQGKLYVIDTEGFSQGLLRKYATDQKGNRTDLLVTVPNFDARTRPWYTAALNRNGPTWSEVYILSTGQDLAVAASRPVYDEQQKLMGVVSVDIFLSHLSNFLKSLTIGKTGQSFIMERSGLLIASSTDEKPFIVLDDREMPQRLQASQSASPLIRAAAKALPQHVGDNGHITTEQQFEFELEGQRHFVNVAPVQTEDGIDWLIVVVIPESDFMTHINANNQTTAALSGLALLITVIFGFVATGWITRPIAQLKVAAQALAQGEWQSGMRAGRIDEIGELTSAFNHMAEQLQQTLASLTAEIAARQQAEAGLQNQLEFVSTLLETMPNPVFYKDRAGRYTGCNRAFVEFLGRSRAEIIGKTVYELAPGDIAAKYYDMDQALFANPGTQTYEWPVLTYRGDERSVIFNKTITKDAAGNITGLVGIMTDITERKQMESRQQELLIEREQLVQRLQLILERMPIGCILSDQDFRVTYWNPAAERIFGFTGAEVLGQSSLNILVPAEIQPYVEGIRQCLLKGDADIHSENENFTKDCRTIICQWHNTPIADSEGTFIGILGMVQDITDRKLLEENLREAKKMEAVGQLAAGMAHHYNSMLTAIIGFTSLSLHQLPPGDPIAQNLDQVLTTAERAAVLVRQLLAFARKQLLQPKTISLNELLLNLKDKLENLLTEGIELNLNLAPDLELVKMDPSQFEHLLLSLASNACDAMPDGGRLTLTTANVRLTSVEANLYQLATVECVLLTVQDTGIGLTDEVKAHLFEPFFTTKEVGQGTGLGLAMALGIAKQHGGQVLAESQPGHGTVFKVYLPWVTAPTPPVTGPVAADLPQGAETILLVEDEPAVRELVAQILNQQGYTVFKAADGQAALQLIAEQADSAPQLLLTNLVMPGLSGYRLVERLRASYPGLKVLFFFEPTGEESPELNRPGTAFLAKPFKPSLLAQKVRAVLDDDTGVEVPQA